MMESTEYDYLAKVIIIGNSNVGKSALLLKYVDDTFATSYKSTIGVDFKARTLEMHGKKVKLQIWDTAGQERYKNIVSAYYRGALGVFVVYSITDEESFKSVSRWLAEVENHAAGPITRVLLASKADLDGERVVLKSRGEQFATEKSMLFFETSAKSGHGVKEAFTAMAESIWEKTLAKEALAPTPELRDLVPYGVKVESKVCCG